MLYYMELDRDKEFLEIHEVKNIYALVKITKINWKTIDDYLNGTDVYRPRLVCGLPKPLIKKIKRKLYMVSYFKEIMNMRNSRYMSRVVMDELDFKNQFVDIYEEK